MNARLLKELSGLAALLAPLALTPTSIGRGQESDRIAVTLDREAGTLSLHAERALISEIVRALERQEGFRVVVPELADRRITVEALDEPIGELFERLLPQGARFWFVDERGESVLPPHQGDKPGRKAQAPRNELPRKEDGSEPEAGASTAGDRLKPPPERALSTASSKGPDQKDAPRTHGPARGYADKASQEPSPAAERHFRLRVRLTRDEATLERVLEVPGPYRRPGRLMGSQLWALEAGETVLAVGSFRDPFEVHSMFPDDRPHTNQRSESATVDLSIEEEAFASQALAAVRIQFYQLTQDPPTLDLNLETFGRLREASERESRAISGTVIDSAFRQENLVPSGARR